MRFQLHIPTTLPGWIEAIWEQRAEGAGGWSILPSGSLEIIFRLGPGFSLKEARTLQPDASPLKAFCFLSGLHTRPLRMNFQDFHVFGVRLHPVAVPVLFGLPCAELRDGAVEGDLFLGDLPRIEDTLRSAPDFPTRTRWMEAELHRRVALSEHHAAAELMRRMLTSPQHGTAGYSRSHLHRLSHQWLGQSPGGHMRLARFVRAVQALHEPARTLTEVGYRVGYFDQAHFIRSFREYAGMTPGEYRARRGTSPGQLPTEDVNPGARGADQA